MPEKEKKETAPNATAGAREAMENTALPLDGMIDNLDRLYRALTGRRAPAAEESDLRPLPVERDPAEFVGEQIERLLRALEQPVGGRAASFSPPLAVWEGERELLVALDVPGASRDQIEVTVEGQTVIVRGKRPLAREGYRLELCEKPLGGFERRVVVPARVDPESISANLADGVLELKLAKRENDPRARREVRVA